MDPGGASSVSWSPSSRTGGLQTPRRGRAPCDPPIQTKVERRPPLLPVGGIAGHEGQTGEENGQTVGLTVSSWVSPLQAPRRPISHTFPPPLQAATSEAPQGVTYAQLNHSPSEGGRPHPPAPQQGSPQQTPVSTLLLLFTSPEGPRPRAPGTRSQGPQEAREQPSVETT